MHFETLHFDWFRAVVSIRNITFISKTIHFRLTMESSMGSLLHFSIRNLIFPFEIQRLHSTLYISIGSLGLFQVDTCHFHLKLDTSVRNSTFQLARLCFFNSELRILTWNYTFSFRTRNFNWFPFVFLNFETINFICKLTTSILDFTFQLVLFCFINLKWYVSIRH